MGAPSGSLGERLRRIGAALVDILQTRLELLASELQEEGLRLGGLLALGALAFFFLGSGLILLAGFFTVLFWESHRLLVLGLFSGGFLLIGLLSAWGALRLVRRKSTLFSASLAELARDRRLLDPEHVADR